MPTVGFYKLDDQRLTGETSVFVNKSSFSDLSVVVTIDTTGRVIAAVLADNYEKLDPAPALKLVREWSFKPPTFEGKLVKAIGLVSVTYRERPIPPDRSIAFPDNDPANTTITLERGACFGSCPDYRVSVHGDGRVEFDTGDDHFNGTAASVHLQYDGHNVLLPGRHTGHVDPAKVARLVDQFRASRFFGLKREYVYGATDNSTQVLTVRIGKSSMTLTDYIGTQAGMPQEIRDLEIAVDEIAGTGRWVNGNRRTLDDLDAAHFDYRSEGGARLAMAAASKLSDYDHPSEVEGLIVGL